MLISTTKPTSELLLVALCLVGGAVSVSAQNPPAAGEASPGALAVRTFLLEALEEADSDQLALLRSYAELRRDEGDSRRYDLGPEPINRLFLELAEEGRTDDAYRVIHVAARFHRESARVQYLHGEAHRMKDETMESVLAYNSALELDPQYGPARERMKVHWGGDSPRRLGDVLLDEARSQDLQAAFNKYGELRSLYYGSGLYDFSVDGLNTYVLELVETERLDEALAMVHLNRDLHGEAPQAEILHGEIHRLRGDPLDEPTLAFQGTARKVETMEAARQGLAEGIVKMHRASGDIEVTGETADMEVDHARAHWIRDEERLARAVLDAVLTAFPEHAGALSLFRDMESVR